MKHTKKVIIAVGAILFLLAAVFLAGRFGWKLLGFRACQGAGIEAVEVSEGSVRIAGFYPGSFPEGFCGCYSKEQGNTLYVGFRFSSVFGFFSPGDFDITIPVKGHIDEVVMKTSRDETSVWRAEQAAVPQAYTAVPEAYIPLLQQYHTALAEAWTAEQMQEAGLNPIVTEICPADPLAQLGYRAEDLDGDGTPELVIGTMAGDDLSGKMVVALYTLPADGAPQLLFDSTAQSCYYYAGNARFANLGSSDLGGSFVTTVRLEDGEMIDMTYTTDPADYIQLGLTPFSQWNA